MADRKLITWTLLLCLWSACDAFSNVANDIFEIHPMNTSVREGDSVVLDCQVMDPLHHCLWVRDYNKYRVSPDITHNYSLVGDLEKGQCSVKIEKASVLRDDGTWVCHVTTEEQRTEISNPATLTVQIPPSDMYITQDRTRLEEGYNITLRAGNDVSRTLACYARQSNPAAKIQWLIDYEIMPSISKVTVNDSLGGKIKTVRSIPDFIVNEHYHMKRLRCQTEHPYFITFQERSCNLIVKYPTSSVEIWRVEKELLNRTDYNINVTIDVGHPKEIECKADGYPEPSYIWKKDVGNVTRNVRNGKLLSVGHKIEDQGIYRCYARNSLNNAEKMSDHPINVTIEYATNSVKVVLNSPDIIEGKNVILTCVANGYPQPEIRWLKGANDQRIQIARGNKLIVYNFTSSDEGFYQCRAFNRHNKKGVAGDPIYLHVHGSTKKYSHARNLPNSVEIKVIFAVILILFVYE